MYLFHSVQCLYCVCTPQPTKTGRCVCFTVYNGCIVCVLHIVQRLVGASVSQCTMPVLCVYSTDHKDWWRCLFHSVHWLYFACAPTGGCVCFTVYIGCILHVLHRVQGLVDMSVSQCTMAVLCACSTAYKDWWMCLFHSVQCLYCACAPQSTRTGGCRRWRR